jgi:hypothetical protein
MHIVCRHQRFHSHTCMVKIYEFALNPFHFISIRFDSIPFCIAVGGVYIHIIMSASMDTTDYAAAAAASSSAAASPPPAAAAAASSSSSSVLPSPRGTPTNGNGNGNESEEEDIIPEGLTEEQLLEDAAPPKKKRGRASTSAVASSSGPAPDALERLNELLQKTEQFSKFLATTKPEKKG